MFCIIASERSRISFAALFVKVSVSVFEAGIPTVSIRYAKREIIVVVLPEPAPAKISTGPSVFFTALA